MNPFPSRLILYFILHPFSPSFGQRPPWPDPVANHVVPYQSLGISHGPVLEA